MGRVLAVTLVACFFGGAIGYFIGVGRPPAQGSVDVGFYQDMTAHHDQAVQIALIELSNGENSTVRTFAQEILISQRWNPGALQSDDLMTERPEPSGAQ